MFSAGYPYLKVRNHIHMSGTSDSSAVLASLTSRTDILFCRPHCGSLRVRLDWVFGSVALVRPANEHERSHCRYGPNGPQQERHP